MGVDIRGVKRKLRSQYRSYREQLTPEQKRTYDGEIFQQLIQMPQFQQANTIFCFVSTLIEVDTHRLIEYCWKKGKQIAVPRCLNARGRMEFYYIRSWNDLERGSFSLLEPNLKKCTKAFPSATDFYIVPGFSFDHKGYRLGFGKGYYDRYLSRIDAIKVGICYDACMATHLPHGRYDVAVDYIITEKEQMSITKGVEDRNGKRNKRKLPTI